MGIELTRSAKKALAALYTHYCQRRAYGQSKQNSTFFMPIPEAIKDGLQEICAAGYAEYSRFCGVVLTDAGIAYMDHQDPETVLMWDLHDGQVIT